MPNGSTRTIQVDATEQQNLKLDGTIAVNEVGTSIDYLVEKEVDYGYFEDLLGYTPP